MSRRFFNGFMDFVCKTILGREFQGSVTLNGKAFFLMFVFALWVKNVTVWPLFPVKSVSSHVLMVFTLGWFSKSVVVW